MTADQIKQQIIDDLKRRFPPPTWSVFVGFESGHWYWHARLHGLSDEYIQTGTNEGTLESLILQVQAIPLPTPVAAGEAERHREVMADFGQHLFDMIHSVCDASKLAADDERDENLRAINSYIDAWRQLKRKNEKLEAEVERLREGK